MYSGTLLNWHPLTADAHDIMDNFEVPIVSQYNSKHPATLYKGEEEGQKEERRKREGREKGHTQTIHDGPRLWTLVDLFSKIIHHHR